MFVERADREVASKSDGGGIQKNFLVKLFHNVDISLLHLPFATFSILGICVELRVNFPRSVLIKSKVCCIASRFVIAISECQIQWQETRTKSFISAKLSDEKFYGSFYDGPRTQELALCKLHNTFQFSYKFGVSTDTRSHARLLVMRKANWI